MTTPCATREPALSPVLRLANLSIEFRRHGRAVRVVDEVSIDVMAGEIVGLIGESGSGKTLTALSALRLLPRGAKIVSGSIELNGISLLELSESEMRKLRGDRIALVPQDAMQSLNPTLRVGRQVGEPLEIHAGASIQFALRKAVDLLASVQIPHAGERAAQYPHQFSGGMQQRAMIAMGLAMNPVLLIADEPTTALDVTVQAEVLKILAHIREERQVAILFITHDLGIVAELCDRVYVMRNGRVVEQGAVETIFTEPQHDYTQMLLNATPSLHQTGEDG
jgi:peptide/nickel transport system ATP-binding protein